MFHLSVTRDGLLIGKYIDRRVTCYGRFRRSFASLRSLGCFYFRCVLSSQWKAVTVSLRSLHANYKGIFEGRVSVSGNKQELVARARGPKTF